MKIEVGIYQNPSKSCHSNSQGWMTVCEQEKIPHKVVTESSQCPVVVCEGNTPDWLPQFMEEGGIVIVTDCNPDTLPFEVEYVADASVEFIDLIELDSTITRVMCMAKMFRGKGLGEINVHENRKKKLAIVQDQFPVFIYQAYGKGGCWYCGLPLTQLLMALGDTLRESSPPQGFTERMVAVDKHGIIRALRNILIRSLNMRNLPYVHLGYYPKDYQSVFTFRVDVDGVFGENLLRVSQAALDYDFTLTFFVNKNLCEKEQSFLLRIDRQHEVGNHAVVHNLYSDYSSNYNNIKNCQQWLDQLGIENRGLWFAAPRGMWNYALHQALEDQGYPYTSDFGCAIAGFPFFPYIHGNRSRTLQIPVNPFSAERAAVWTSENGKGDLTSDFIATSFTEIIHHSYQQGYPIMLYSHPEKFGPMAEAVFEKIHAALEDLNVWKTTLSEFASWWLRRDNFTYEAEYDPQTKKVSITGDFDADINIKEIFI